MNKEGKMFVARERWQDGVACRTFFPSYSSPFPLLHPCTPTFQLPQGSCSIHSHSPRGISPSLCNGSFLSQSSLCLLSLTMFLSFLLLFTAYLKKQSVFTAFHLNLLVNWFPILFHWNCSGKDTNDFHVAKNWRTCFRVRALSCCCICNANHSNYWNSFFLWILTH